MSKKNDKEAEWDKILNIKTSGRDDSIANQYNYPYEPTPYCVLERLGNSGYINKKDILLDYGCGKGRVDFYLAYQDRCNTIGIEYDERLYKIANENREKSKNAVNNQFVLTNAIDYSVGENVNRIYFFNPFSVEVLKSVIGRIKESFYAHPREILLFFYYPSDEYIGYLMTEDRLIFSDEISCQDLFDGNNQREKILIFEMI